MTGLLQALFCGWLSDPRLVRWRLREVIETSRDLTDGGYRGSMRRRWYLYTAVIQTVQPAYAAVRTITHQRGRQQREYGSAACAAPVGSLAAPIIFTSIMVA
jgi:hypothetical protein